MNGDISFSESVSEERDRIYGVVVGIVKSNKPNSQGEVEILLPSLTEVEIRHRARVATLMAGKERGTFFLPQEDDEVLVAFECGDITRPYVIGALWNTKDAPPEKNEDGKNNLRLIKSRSGHLVRLDDTDGKEKIEIIDKSGKNKLTFDTKENTITLASDKDVIIQAPQGKITLNAKSIEIKSSAETKVEATAALDVKSDATLTVKGKTVNIN